MNLTEFGKQLQALRKARQWSQEALIEALDELARSGPPTEYRVIDGTLLSRWERAHSQKSRIWKPTRAYMLHLIQLFAPHLDLVRAEAWADQAGYAISTAELQTWFPSPAAAPSMAIAAPMLPHNLPTTLTSFVGREAEVVRLVDHLSTSTRRLITLVGEGGVGKTRLALHIAHTVVDQALGAFGDGVYFVALAGINATDFMVNALANELRLGLTGAGNPEQQLFAYLRTRRLFLVLDNFEHLVGTTTPLITAILQAAPGVQLLVTSRERLNLAEEWVLPLSGLPFPTGGATAGQDPPAPPTLPANGMAEVYGAVQLFMVRAQQADAQFAQQDDPVQSTAITRICSLLQGVPLGIEMAAAWVHLLSCTQIADEIARNLDFLTLPHRNVAPRHRSMRAVFEQSWRLLSEAEQHGLAAFAVFQGGFTREAAAQVAVASLLTLRSLVDKSLLKFVGERYELHELLRQFAEEQLKQNAAQHIAVAARHSRYYLYFLAERERRLAGVEAQSAAVEIQAEFSNIRQAWAWAATQQHLGDVERSLYALWRFYLFTGASSEGEHLIKLVLDQIAAVASSGQGTLSHCLLSKLLTMRAMFLKRLGYVQQALQVAEEAVAVAERCLAMNRADPHHRAVKAFAHSIWGLVLIDMGELTQAHAVCMGGLQLLAERPNDGPTDELMSDMEWQLRLALGSNYGEMNDYQPAREYVTQALESSQKTGKVRGQLSCLANLGWFGLLAGDYAAARQAYERALPLSRRFGYRLEEAANLVELGDTVRLQGEYGLAQELLVRGWQLADEISAYTFRRHAVRALVSLYSYMGADQQAQHWLDQAHPAESNAEDEQAVARALLALQQSNYSQALDTTTRAWQLVQKSSNRSTQASVLVIMGHAQAGLQLWLVATDSYMQALAIYITLNQPALAVEAQAGLAAVALAQGDLAAAVKQVEPILPVLAEAPYVGIDEPFYTYWACYRVLTAAQDERTAPLLENANRRLEQYASHIYDDALRQSFWEHVAVHRNLRVAYGSMPATTQPTFSSYQITIDKADP